MASRWKRARTLRKEYEEIVEEIVSASIAPESVSKPPVFARSRGTSSSSDASSSVASISDVTASDVSSTEESDSYSGDDCEQHFDHTGSVPSTSGAGVAAAFLPEPVPSATEELAAVARQRGLSHGTVNAFAAVLRKLGHDVPKDARTILGTERRALLQQDNTFVHFGLKKGIIEALSQEAAPSEITLQANVDGLPLFKSSSVGFWPILCRVTNSADSTPFIVSLFCGSGKPPDLEAFLGPFLLEMQELIQDGLFHKGRHSDVRLTAVVCDAPARSFVKRIKSHNGYNGCERCSTKGLFVERRVTFPELDAPLRTDGSFRSQDDQAHHTGTTPFTSLNLDMVSLFPLDYMHLVCLGIMRRMLRNWICGRGRLTRAQKQELSSRLRSCAPHFPQHFQRKPRGVEELDRWKATEFRAFLLYVGPVVLKGILPKELYKHFLVLHVAMKILISPTLHIPYNSYAKELLQYFVREFGRVYGAEQLSYNIHTVSHLAEECLIHGPLDAFSAFGFESYLGKIKGMVRSPNNPLAQISRRLSEHVVPTSEVCSARRMPKEGDCFLLNDSPVMIVKVTADTCETAALQHTRDFFRLPVPSSSVGTLRADSVQSATQGWPLAAFENAVQCVMLPYKMGFVVTPLLHQW